MTQSSNGQPLPQPEGVKQKRHNATLLDGRKRQAIVTALANGDSIRAIARALQVSNNTVVAIRDQDWQQVAARKERIAAQAELGATEAGDRLIDAIRSGVISGQGLIPAFGVCVDKMVALRGDVTQTIRHLHSVDLTDDDLIAFAVQRSKRLDAEKHAQAAVVEVPALPDAEHPPSANTRNRNPRKH
jgi:Homeodomain-like domain